MSEIRINQVIRIGEAKTKKLEPKKEEETTELQAKAPEVKRKSADEVLDYLSNSSIASANKSNNAKSKKIEVSKYVNPEQALGIAESVNKFFEGMEQYVEQAMSEFNLSSSQAQKLTALHFNLKMDEDYAIVASGEKLIIR